MDYMYYMGGASGPTKKDPEKKWFALQVLRESRYGSIELKPLFVQTEEKWNKLLASAPPIGSPVDIQRNLDDEVTAINLIKDVPPLELY